MGQPKYNADHGLRGAEEKKTVTGAPAIGLRLLSIMLGTFLTCMGLGKTGWLLDGSVLLAQLQAWLEFAHPISRWYLETVAIPGAPIFGRLVLLGELAAGVSLIIGYRSRLVAALALMMILNFHVAMGIIFQLEYLTNGYGLPVVGGLLALALGAARLPFSISNVA